MAKIEVERNPPRERLETRGVFGWPIWEKEAGEFPWEYDGKEHCYFLAGRVTVTPEGGAPVDIRTHDFVTFPAGLRCRWVVHEAVRKHYDFP